jgi:xanthine dehydrogenase accessory factor
VTNRPEFFDRVAALTRIGQPFALATVVARRPPVSAHLGDRAIVFADGRMDGFVGGACSREIIRRQALEALKARAARLVCIRPDPSEATMSSADRIVVPMTCASEGAVDVYVEPIIKARIIVVAGTTPVADAVARIARAMRYAVVRVVEGEEERDVQADAEAIGARVAPLTGLEEVLAAAMADAGECAAVVASQGHYDEPALEAFLRAGVPYAGLVASHKRGATVRASLADGQVPNLDRLHYPAGLDLGAHSPEEVAIAILGEIVQQAAAAAAQATIPEPATTIPGPETVAPSPRQTAIDPVCRMEVAIAGATHTAEVDGAMYYFCCGGCRTRFLKDPRRYLSPAS